MCGGCEVADAAGDGGLSRVAWAFRLSLVFFAKRKKGKRKKALFTPNPSP